MKIREAEKSDLPAIIALAAELAAHVEDPAPSLTVAQLSAACLGSSSHCRLLVADSGDDVLGFVAVSTRFEVHTASLCVFVSDLVVTSERRGQKVGAALLDGVKGSARAMGATKISFELWKGNETARRFYETHGAVPAGDIALYEIGLA